MLALLDVVQLLGMVGHGAVLRVDQSAFLVPVEAKRIAIATGEDFGNLLPFGWIETEDAGGEVAPSETRAAAHIGMRAFAETADVRSALRYYLWDHATLITNKHDRVKENDGLDYKDYFQFKEPIRTVPPHRILAINRGEKENILSVKLEFDPAAVERVALDNLPLADHPHAELLRAICVDALPKDCAGDGPGRSGLRRFGLGDPARPNQTALRRVELAAPGHGEVRQFFAGRPEKAGGLRRGFETLIARRDVAAAAHDGGR